MPNRDTHRDNKKEAIMVKDWIVVFQNLNTGKVNIDTFTENSESAARRAFWACYRHGDYRILTVVEKPEVENA